MPNSKSAAKRVRQNEKRRAQNRTRKSGLKTAIRRVKEATAGGDDGALRAAVSEAYKKIDKAAKGNVLHPNTAARRKAMVARLARPAAG